MFDQDFILVVEDTRTLAAIYEECLIQEGYDVKVAANGMQALAVLEKAHPQAILLDLNLPDIQGIEILKEARSKDITSAVIVITGEATLTTAVEAMREGADDFVAKPVDPERLLISLANAIEKRQLKKMVRVLEQTDRAHFCGFIGKSAEMQAMYRVIENAAGSHASVMIMGESGTGKELTAKAVHGLSMRKNKPFVALNCAAIPHDLLESEIFGHVRGAFTGATENRDGAAKRAHGGVLFLDELTEMPIALQSKLLRFIQEGVFSPVGSNETHHVDIRFICATNRNPFDAIAKQLLREDLYYRLAVIPVELPPLRRRGHDVVLLAEHFLEKAAEQEQKRCPRLTDEAKNLLLQHRWPGNVRELENIIRHAVVMHHGDQITGSMLPFGAMPPAHTVAAEPLREAELLSPPPPKTTVAAGIRPMKEVERETIEQALELCNGNITEAAKQLGLNPATIHRKRKQWEDEAVTGG